jgi:hypothetical protein
MEYVGIDLHKKESQICLLTETGEVIVKARPEFARKKRMVEGPAPPYHDEGE